MDTLTYIVKNIPSTLNLIKEKFYPTKFTELFSPSLLSLSSEPPQSDAQLEAALNYRTEKQQIVTDESNRSTQYTNYLKSTNVPAESIKDYTDYIKAEVAWWTNSNNYNSDKQTYRIRITQFVDAINTKRSALNSIATENLSNMNPDAAQAILDDPANKGIQIDITTDQLDSSRAERDEAQLKATPGTIAQSVFQDVLPWVKFLFFFFVAFRLASITANELLYKHASYRVLAFVYIFYLVLNSSLFSIPIILYYLYKEYSRFIFSGQMDYPIYYSALPLQRVVTLDNPPIYNPWYQYPSTADAWIAKQQESELKGMLTAISNTKNILRSLQTFGGNPNTMMSSLNTLSTKMGFKQGSLTQAVTDRLKMKGQTVAGVGRPLTQGTAPPAGVGIPVREGTAPPAPQQPFPPQEPYVPPAPLPPQEPYVPPAPLPPQEPYVPPAPLPPQEPYVPPTGTKV
jgi:hypothetical protein